MDNQLLESIITRCRPLTKEGKTATYIPQLQTADPDTLGICLCTSMGGLYTAGDAHVRFTIQSISKVLVFTCCLLDNSLEQVLQKVSLEPTSDGFNSIVNLETKNYNRPLNPMINSGAIATLSMVRGSTPGEKFSRILALARLLSGNDQVDVDMAVYQSEKESGSRNRALAYYMHSTGILEDDVEELLDAYFRTCSLQMDCVDLARVALVYAQDGWDIHTKTQHFSKEIARTVKAIITLCGMYDESGRVAVEIGLPSKSGVGGGIMSIAPGKMGIGIYGPALNAKGSSVAGLAALTQLAQHLDLCIF